MNPELYFKYGVAHQPHVVASYDKLFKLLRWIENEKIMDIGCGAGNVLMNILVPRLPKSLSQIVACDISKNMIQFCRSLSTTDRISFIELDIETEKLSIDLEGQFQHLFSTFCVTYCKDLSRALRNCFKLMKPGGQLLFVFPTTSFLHQMYKKMSKGKIKGLFPFLLKYQNYEDPFDCQPDHEVAVADFFRNVGFDVEYCEVINKYMDFSSPTCVLNTMQALDLEVKNILEIDIEEYKEAFLHAVITDPNSKLTVNEKGETVFKVLVPIASIVARRPIS